MKEKFKLIEPSSPCPQCKRFTFSIRVSRALFKCEICNHDKTISDVYWHETRLKKKIKVEKEQNSVRFNYFLSQYIKCNLPKPELKKLVASSKHYKFHEELVEWLDKLR